VLAWLDADCRAPLQWLERVEARFGSPRVVAVSGPLRYYDWDWFGRGLMRAYDLTVAPLTHVAVRDVARCGAILYGGDFAVRAALGVREWISADQTAEAILRDIRRQDALSIACHPHHRTTRRIEISTCYLWDHRDELAPWIDLWEAGNRDDLFSVAADSAKTKVANSDFHRPRHLHSWKTLLRAPKHWAGIKAALRSNVDVAVCLYRPASRRASALATAGAAPWHEGADVPAAISEGSAALAGASS